MLLKQCFKKKPSQYRNTNFAGYILVKMSKDPIQTGWKAGVQQRRCQMFIPCASCIPRFLPIN